MKKIGEGKYQKVYLKDNFVYKYTHAEKDWRNQILKIKKYYFDIVKIGIKSPSYLKFQYKDPFLVTISKHCGDPLEKLIPKISCANILKIHSKILNYSLVAFKSQIAFYPKINQFTYKEDAPYFIDFYPSRTIEDFKEYSDEKRNDLGMVFYGLTQKILTPTKEIIKIRPDLKKPLCKNLQLILEKTEYKVLLPDFNFCLNYENKYSSKNQNYRGFVFLKDVSILLPSQHIWTKKLFDYDQSVVTGVLKTIDLGPKSEIK